jgi:hypothetical protein
MAVDSINFLISINGESKIRDQSVLQKLNKEKMNENETRINYDAVNKQKKHIKTIDFIMFINEQRKSNY